MCLLDIAYLIDLMDGQFLFCFIAYKFWKCFVKFARMLMYKKLNCHVNTKSNIHFKVP